MILKRTACWIKNWTFKWICVLQKKNKNTKGTGKVPVLILLIISNYFVSELMEVLLLCFLFCVFQVLLISRASTWRAGETKDDALPNLKPLLLTSTSSIFVILFYLICVYG